MNNISSRLKLIAKNHNLNLKQLADKLGISPVALNNYINNDRLPSAKILLKIKQMFNDVSIDWLLTGSEEIEKKSVTTEESQRTEDLRYTIKLQREKIDLLEKEKAILKKEIESITDYHIAAEPTPQLKTNK